eukprot:CAMPEP_0202694964 /NCGR_PEP_ID=MMETSP1385-20130828/8683_1 /ASSEMBLY_ACC=CAM_ASM_000861 /TAXON_ID=933848 /ORGANISM="Elphidium margaritaceum" /LENGTH=187 /DNA_ID=CAMNT_0049350909 /DNA_START=23 /DNA_END=582 /DNA_ORIENTATION=+
MSFSAAEKFGSIAGAKVAYLKQLKYQDWHRKRLVAHIRSEVFGTNEYLAFMPSKLAGRKKMTSRLKGPIIEHFYSDNDDRVLYSMTRNRKSHMAGITTYEQQTLFPYRRRKSLYWKHKVAIQIGKRVMAKKMPPILTYPHRWLPAAYQYHPGLKRSVLKRRLRGLSDKRLDPSEKAKYDERSQQQGT